MRTVNRIIIAAVLLLLTTSVQAQAPKGALNITTNLALQGGSIGFFDTNRTALSNALSQTFARSNILHLLTVEVNTLSNRVNSLEAVTNAFGDIITTDIADYATAAQGVKADAAIQGIIVTGNATGETNGNVVTVNVTGGGGSSAITPMAYTLTTISNSNVETDVLSVTITNNTFTTGKTLRVKLFGDFVKNTGGTEATTNMIKFGETYMYKDSLGNMPNSVNNRLPRVDIYLKAASNTSQTVRVFCVYGTGGTADIGSGDAGVASVQRIFTASGTATEDMTSGNKTFSFAVNFSGAHGSLYWIPTDATVEMINAP